MTRVFCHRKIFVCGAVCLSALIPATATAAFVYWDGTGTAWNVTTSWSTVNNATTPDPAAPPGASDLADFPYTLSTPQTVNLNAAQAAQGLLFETTGGAIIQSGSGTNTLTIGPTGIGLPASAGTVTITAPISLAADQEWDADSFTSLNVTNNINNGAYQLTVHVRDVCNATLGGVLGSGSGGFTKTGPGTLALNGANTYTGVTNINEGTVVLGNASALGSNLAASGTIISSGATLDLGGQSVAEPVGISGTGVGGNGALINSSGTAASLSGTITLGGDTTVGSGNITLSGAVNSYALTKTGSGTLTLSGTTDNVSLGVAANAGTVVLAKTSSTGPDVHAVGGNGLTVNGGTAQLAGTGNDQIWNYANATVTSGALDTNGRNETLSRLALQGTGFSGAGALINTALNAGSVITPTTGTLLTGNTTIGVDSGASYIQLNNVISGNFAITKVGSGNLYLTGTNIFSGGLAIQSGALQIDTINNASTNGPLGNNTSVTLGSSGQTGTLTYTGGSATTSMPFVLATGGTGAFFVSSVGETLTLNGAISGAGTLRAQLGIMALGASNTFTGGVTIDNGHLVINNAGALNSSVPNAVTFSDSVLPTSTGKLTLRGNSLTISGLSTTGSGSSVQDVVENVAGLHAILTINNATSNTFAGVLQDGSGSAALWLTKLGSGTLTLSGNNSYSGATTVSDGTLVLGNASALGGTANGTSVTSGGTLDLGGQAVGNESLGLYGVGVLARGALVNNSANAASVAGAVNLNASSYVGGSGNITLSGSVFTSFGNALTKVGNNTLTLSGTTDNANLGVIVNSGTVVLAKTSSGLPNEVHAIGAGSSVGLMVNGGTAQLAGTGNDQIWDSAGVSVTSGTFDTNARSETFSTLSLQGTGFASAGALVNTAAALSTITPTNGTTLTGNTTIGVTQSAGSLTLNNAISGNFALTKVGAGTLRLSGNSTFSGGFNLNQGTLLVKSSSALGAGPMTIASTGTLGIEIGGTLAGSQYDHVNVLGQLSLGGTLAVSLTGGFAPAAGNSFDVLDWGSRIGTFNTITLPALSAGLIWNTSQLYTSGTLNVTIAGDFNGNGFVDAADYVVWRKGLGTTFTQPDYDIWRAHFGQSAGSGSSFAAGAVPEPPSVTLLVFMLSLIATRSGVRTTTAAASPSGSPAPA